MMLSEDGSGKGAALVAAVAHRMQLVRRASITAGMSTNSMSAGSISAATGTFDH